MGISIFIYIVYYIIYNKSSNCKNKAGLETISTPAADIVEIAIVFVEMTICYKVSYLLRIHLDLLLGSSL